MVSIASDLTLLPPRGSCPPGERAIEAADGGRKKTALPLLSAGQGGKALQGSYDLTFLRCIPNMVIMAPADEHECRDMLYTATTLSSPSAVRYPRGTGPGVAVTAEFVGCHVK